MAANNINDVDRLLRGISTDHPETVRDAWRALISAGKPAVLQVLDRLATPAWSDYPKGPFAQYLGGPLSVLYELDPVAFRREIKAPADGQTTRGTPAGHPCVKYHGLLSVEVAGGGSDHPLADQMGADKRYRTTMTDTRQTTDISQQSRQWCRIKGS